jgi:hypothetical protein
MRAGVGVEKNKFCRDAAMKFRSTYVFYAGGSGETAARQRGRAKPPRVLKNLIPWFQ